MTAPNIETSVSEQINLGPAFYAQTVSLVGTATNDNATAGNVGEFVSASALTVALTSATATNITSITLTAGDWDVSGLFQTNPAGSTTTSLIASGVSSTSATFQTIGAGFANVETANSAKAAGVSETVIAPRTRFSLSATTTVYLVANVTFAVSTLTGSGFISARRVR